MGNAKVIEKMSATGALLLEEAYESTYPRDGRAKKPTIFRATLPWFTSVEGFRPEALLSTPPPRAPSPTRPKSFL